MQQGVLYIVFGLRYQAEARKSMASLRKASPGIPVAVITDSEWAVDPRPDIFILRETEASYGLKMRYAHESPFDRTLSLDSDTIVARDISPVFGMLDYYDLGCHFDGPPINEPNGLQFQTRCATSVFLFAKNDCVATFFALWSKEYYQQKADLEASGHVFDKRGLDDTRSCAIAIAKSKVRAFQLGSFLYFNVDANAMTRSPPIIYHGRIPFMEMLDEEISKNWRTDQDWQVRLWLPNIRGLLPNGVRRSDPILATALILRRICNTARRYIKRFRKPPQ